MLNYTTSISEKIVYFEELSSVGGAIRREVEIFERRSARVRGDADEVKGVEVHRSGGNVSHELDKKLK